MPLSGGLGRIAARVLLALFAALSSLPIVAGLIGWHPGSGAGENRVLAALPTTPHTLHDLTAYPAALSTYLDDHYGLRELMVATDGRLRYHLFGEFASDQVRLGRHGRLFFISHVAGAPFSLTDRICGTNISDSQAAEAAAGLGRLIDEGRDITPETYYVAVPTTPVIDHDDLPRWLAARCNRTAPSVPRIARSLAVQRPEIGNRLVSPEAALNEAKTHGLPYPIWAFHWSGIGARAVTEAIGGGVLGRPKRIVLSDKLVLEQSDLAQFTPGLRHRDLVPFPDHAAAGVDFCYGGGGACGADLAPFGHAINEITRSNWTQGKGPSLLIISDSFGRMPAQYFSEYFAKMLHLNIAFERLQPGELERLAAQIAADGRPDTLLFLFHDAAAMDAGGLAGPFAAISAAFRTK